MTDIIYVLLIYTICMVVFRLLLPAWIPIVKTLGRILLAIAIVAFLTPVWTFLTSVGDDFHRYVNFVTGVEKKASAAYDAVTGIPEKLEQIPIVGTGVTKYPPAKTFRERLPFIGKGYFTQPVNANITQSFDGKDHHGLDFACNLNTPVQAAREGKVIQISTHEIYGNFILVDHGGGWQTLYAHLNKATVEQGKYVWANDQIGLSGNTGKSSGPHLHFEIRVGGKAIDSKPWMK